MVEFILVDGWMIPAPDTLRVAVSLLLVASLVVAVALLFADSSKVNSENEPLLLRNVHKNKNEFLLGFDKHLWIFGALTLWCHIGEFVGVLIPYLPKNPKLPPFNQPVPELCIVIGFALSCVVWVVLPLVLKLHERQNFHGMVFVIYSLETVFLLMYIFYPKDSNQPAIFILQLEYLVFATFRFVLSFLTVGTWIWIKYQKHHNRHVNLEDTRTKDFDPPASLEDFITDFKKLLPFMWPKKSLKLQFMMVISFVSMGLGRYVNPMVPIWYKSVVDSLSDVPNGTFKIWVDQMGLKTIPYGDILVFVTFRLLSGSSGLLNTIQSALWVPIGQYTTKQVSLQMFDHLHRLSLRFHLNRKTGEILRVQDRGVSSIVSLLNSILFNVIPNLADILIACLYFTVQFDLYFGFIVFTTMICYIYSTIWITEWRTKYRRGANALENEMEAKAVDSLINFETVKYYSAEVFESIQYEKAIDEYQVADFLSTATMWILDLFQNLISQIGLLIGSLLCAKRICYDQTMTVGDFVFFLSYLTQLYGPLNYFGNYYKTIQKNFVDMEKLLDLFDMEIEVKDLPDAMDIVVADTSIRFENVNFSYDPRKKILNDISFTVPHGETVALVGQSGSGKSTIMKLLFRFYDVESGEITIGGKNISTVTQMSIRQMIGVVPQDTVLFNADISYNIRYGRPSATDEELRKASKAAQIHERILGFPDGYETKVGERGLRLSGGEKQRVAIARTLLKDPKILALDEATSALDSNSETAVQEAFLRQGRTCLVIAHRLSTIKTAHKILVMREGRIVERGNHDILMALKGEYYQMWTKQSKEANPQLI